MDKSIFFFYTFLLAAKSGAVQKANLLTKNIEEFSGKSPENGPADRKKRQDRKSNRTRQKNNRPVDFERNIPNK